MECYFPGRILVGPSLESEGTPFLIEQISEELRGEFEFEFGIADVLIANHFELDRKTRERLPFVGRVPEGAEEEFSTQIAAMKQVGAATPDYIVYPNASFTINDAVIDHAIHLIGAHPGSQHCGDGCRVGVLDSGIDPNHVATPMNVNPKQLDALNPRVAGKAPFDPTGHGSLIAQIISKVAPGAELISIRTFDKNGTISNVIAALYLAVKAGPCDVINLSLSVSCAPVPCSACGTPTVAAMNIHQLCFFFETVMRHAPDTVLLAAAGNNMSHLAYPAAFDRIVAIGSFDYANNTPISKYRQVPMDRFVLSPGGGNSAQTAYAERQMGFSKEYLHGTSFAAAFVTGFAAKTICNIKSSSCGTSLVGSPSAAYGSGVLSSLLGELSVMSDRTWPGFDPMKHGFGAIHF